MSAEVGPAEGPDPSDLPRVCWGFAESSPEPLIAVDGPVHVIRYANPAFARLAGRDQSGLVGRPFAVAVPAGPGNGCLPLLNRVYRTGTAGELGEQQHRRPALTYWSYSAWPVVGAGGRTGGIVVRVTDAVTFPARAEAIVTRSAMTRSTAARRNSPA